jgi:hypothetical protein
MIKQCPVCNAKMRLHGFDKLLTSLRTAWANELTLDKNQTSYNDLHDGLRLGLKAYEIE